MKARTKRTSGVKMLLYDSEELQESLSMGKNSAVALAEKAGAVRRFSNRLVRYDVQALERYINEMEGNA